MEFTEALQKRTSIRDFKDTPLSKDDLTAIVKEAQLAPSWANSQPWKVYIAAGKTMQALRRDHLHKNEEGRKGYPDLPTKDLPDWGKFPYDNMTAWLGKVEGDPVMKDFAAANSRLWNAPAMAYITVSRTAPVWSVYDAGAFAQTLMLSAADKGIDSMVAYENIKFPDEIREHLGVPDDEIVVMGIALGYRSDDVINTFQRDRVATEEMLVIRD